MHNAMEELYAQLDQRGLKGRVVSIERLQDLKEDIEGRHAQGLFDERFYQERLSFFDFDPPNEAFVAKSLIIVAMPRPQTRVSFTWNGRGLTLLLPPTYLEYARTSGRIAKILEDLLALEGYHIAPAKLPLKSLAVRSGLGEYGRNNICYVPGMGSFLQLAGCYSDLPCGKDPWREPVMMEVCQDCLACQRKCPTQAIPSERFLLRAERCIVYHNEKPVDHPFPDWLDLSSHDCLLGCMVCQRYCPVDKPFLGWFEGDERFTEEESAWLLEGSSPDQLPSETVQKLERLQLLDDLGVISRNLKARFKTSKLVD